MWKTTHSAHVYSFKYTRRQGLSVSRLTVICQLQFPLRMFAWASLGLSPPLSSLHICLQTNAIVQIDKEEDKKSWFLRSFTCACSPLWPYWLYWLSQVIFPLFFYCSFLHFAPHSFFLSKMSAKMCLHSSYVWSMNVGDSLDIEVEKVGKFSKCNVGKSLFIYLLLSVGLHV